MWTGVSIIMLLGGIGFMASWYASRKPEPHAASIPADDPLLGSVSTPSQRALVKYFWIVAALILVQMAMGVVTAHYGVEGDGFYGLKIASFLPYAVVAHLARAARDSSGSPPRGWPPDSTSRPRSADTSRQWQRLGVNVLFGALLVVVAGSMAGQWLSIKQMLPDSLWFWFGHRATSTSTWAAPGRSPCSSACCSGSS